MAIYTDPGTDYTVCVSCSVDRTWKIWDLQSILDTFYYPTVEDDEYVEGVTLVGRNGEPPFNPTYSYKDKKGVKKVGYVKEITVDDGDMYGDMGLDPGSMGLETGGMGHMEEEDYELSGSEDEDAEYISLPSVVPKSKGVGLGVVSPSGVMGGGDGLPKILSVGRMASPVVSASDGSVSAEDIRNMEVVPGSGSGSRRGSFIQELRKLSIHQFTPTAEPVPGEAPDLNDMKRQTDDLRKEHAAALALVHRETTVEKQRAAQKLAVRLTTRGLVLCNPLSPLTIDDSDPQSSHSSTASPMRPGVASSFGSNLSPNVGISRGRQIVDPTTTPNTTTPTPNKAEISTKNKLLMQHHIESARHHSVIQTSQRRSQIRLEQRLSRQAKHKVDELSLEMRAELTKEIENNSDDDVDATEIAARKKRNSINNHTNCHGSNTKNNSNNGDCNNNDENGHGQDGECDSSSEEES